MVSDGGDDGGNVVRVGTHVVQETESHDGAALSMFYTVDDIADIMEEAGYFYQLNLMIRMSESFEDFCCSHRYLGNMSKAVLCIAKGSERLIGLFNVCVYSRILPYVFKCNLQN